MKTKHTPGPWKLEKNSVLIPVYGEGAGSEPLRLKLHKTEGENLANAALIAAAPELLQALEYLLQATPPSILKRKLKVVKNTADFQLINSRAYAEKIVRMAKMEEMDQ